jgi:pyruvate formate-lyase/glycerol dehydratase family glycyl radical enzyme
MKNMSSMNQLPMVDQVNKVVALTDRVDKRKQEYLDAIPHIDVERSRLVTESWKETEGEPLDIREAKLFKKIMDGIPVSIKDGELIVGSQTQYIRGSGPKVEWRSDFAFQLAAMDKPSLSGMVKVFEVSEEERASLLEDAEYWKGRAAGDRIHEVMNGAWGEQIDDLVEARVFINPIERPAHGEVDFDLVLNKGINSIIADAKGRLQKLLEGDYSDRDAVSKEHFLQAVIIACEGAIDFAHRYGELARELASRESDATRKRELEEIADICEWVPAHPARNFREALQSFWFVYMSAILCHNRANEVPGRMDQYLYPFYERDIETGRLTRQEAAELLGFLWVKFAEREASRGKVDREKAEANVGQLITIGGVNGDGKDASNELTYLLLEVARQLRTVQPPLYLRCHVGTPAELWMKAMEVLRDRGDGVPGFVSDRAVLLNLSAWGIPIQEARDYIVQGCVHPRVSKYSVHGATDAIICVAKILELTLNNGVEPRTGKLLGLATGDPRDFSSFNQLYEAYKRQCDFFFDLFAKYMRMYWQVRNSYFSAPFFSAFLGDCIEKGLDLTRGGCRYPQLWASFYERGDQNVADSLAAMKKVVFEDKKLTMDQVLEALEANFEGNGNKDIQRMLLAAPKYGNDDDYVDDIFNDLSLWTQYRLTKHKTIYGENSRIQRGGATHHVYFGKTIGATPDGRKAWEPLADGNLSPVRGMDSKGPTAVINSASKVNHTEIACSCLFNMKFFPSTMRTREGRQRLIDLIKTFQDRGGYYIQFNVQGTETLRRAKENPEQYRDLLVRVAGYSAYFVDLSPSMQDEILARTEHAL